MDHLAAAVLLAGLGVAGGVSALPTCTTFAKVDMGGHDILPPYPPKVTTAEACCAKAKAMPDAIAFAFDLVDGTCYVKGAGAAPSGSNVDRLSGFANSTCTCDGGAFPPPCWVAAPPCTIGPPAPSPSPGERPILAQYRCLKATAMASPFAHCDASKTVAERVASIVANLTASEMVRVVLKQPIDRLGIPSYNMWSTESLHGVRLWPEQCPFATRCTTIFPTASTASRSFNRSLWRAVGIAMGTEARVLWNLNIINDLSLRGPQVNIQRDPRWGRNSNSPSEDPLLTGAYGAALVRGTQLRDDEEGLSGSGAVHLMLSQMKVSSFMYRYILRESCSQFDSLPLTSLTIFLTRPNLMKHWTGYTVEANRFGYNGNFSLHDLAETYMRPMEMMVKVNVSSAMCSCVAPCAPPRSTCSVLSVA